MDFNPSLEILYKVQGQQHLEKSRNATVVPIHGNILVVHAGVHVEWQPQPPYENLEIFAREQLLYPALRRFSRLHDQSLKIVEHRRRVSTLVSSMQLRPEVLHEVMSSVVVSPTDADN
jgi:hypothetical protein